TSPSPLSPRNRWCNRSSPCLQQLLSHRRSPHFWFRFRPASSLAGTSTCLSIRQRVIVALSGLLREVLDELSIVALRIVEIPALAVGMRVRWRGVLVSGWHHSLT